MIPEEFITTISPSAQSYQQKYGILTSITIAQAALETGWGKFLPVDKYDGRESLNLFGIKGVGPTGSVICDTLEFRGGKMVNVEDKFRAYNSWEESIADHSAVLLTSLYKPVRNTNDWRTAAMYLQSCGYATDPHYSNKLIQIIDQYQLYKYDILPTPFPDVSLEHWAKDAVMYCKLQGLLVGKDDGLFHGDENITRYELATVIKLLRSQ